MKTFILLVLLSIFSYSLVKAEFQGLATAKDVAMFREAKFKNVDEIALSVNFFNFTRDPYPKNYKGYDVSIDYSQNCYVVFLDEDRTEYNMIESPEEPPGDFGVFMTHTGPCGVCSDLKDLATYLESPELTSPVTKCAKMLIPSRKKQCLRDIGFSERCMHIWYFNTLYTRNGCFNLCIRYQFKPRNQPEGKYNPCKPIAGVLPAQNDDDPDLPREEEEDGAVVNDQPNRPTSTNAIAALQLENAPRRSIFERISFGIDKKIFDLLKKRKKTIGCRNSINNQPACHPLQWQNNPQRLNPCLQCDECKSGPMFQKVSGRQRRNSGIKSGIPRPGVMLAEVDHHYYTEG